MQDRGGGGGRRYDTGGEQWHGAPSGWLDASGPGHSAFGHGERNGAGVTHPVGLRFRMADHLARARTGD